MEKTNFSSHVYASNSLLAKLCDKLNIEVIGREKDYFPRDGYMQALHNAGIAAISFAYTDYGGSFFDYCYIEYLREQHPDNIVFEFTSYSGHNALVFNTEKYSNIVEDINHAISDYILNFEDMEEFFYSKEQELHLSAVASAINDLIHDYEIITDMDTLQADIIEFFCTHASIVYTAINYSSNDLKHYLIENNLIRKLTHE